MSGAAHGGARPFAVRLCALVASIGVGAGSAAMAQPMAAQDFVNAAAQSDAYEIAAGQLSLTQSSDPAVQRFARQMIQDHQQTSASLRAASSSSGLSPPAPGLGGDQQRFLNALQSQKGADLDRSFWTQQVNAHAAALTTEQAYAAQGADPRLREAAQSAVPIIARHLDMARQMLARLPPT